MGAIKGICAGLLIGLTAVFLVNQVLNNDRRMKRKANKAMHAVEDLLSDVQDKFR